MFAATKYTKEDVADYYRAVAAWMLPELVERPLSLVRCPDGADASCFFQKHHAATLGAHVAAVALEEKDGARDDYLYVRDLAGVLELVQMNALEFHPWGARVDRPDQPDRLVFDLDPAPGVEWKAVVAAAREVRAQLHAAGPGELRAPVRRQGRCTWWCRSNAGPPGTRRRPSANAFAEAMVSRQPLRYVATTSKAKREGRIFIDWLRNARGATSVASWSLRARAGAPVAMPLRWDELGRTRSAAAFDLKSAQRRAQRLRADPWAGFTTLRQKLPAAASLA